MDINSDNFQKNDIADIFKLKEYLKKNPNNNNARLNLAYMFVNLNLINEAINQYQIILKKKKDVQTMFNLAICFSSLNKFSESERILKKIIKIDKNHFKTLRALGDIYLNLNKIEKANKFLNLAKQIISNDPILLNIMGLVEMKRSNYPIAEKNFLDSIKNKKSYKNALNNLAALYQKTGKLNKSLEILNELLHQFPNDKNLLNNIGNVFIDLNQYENAIKYINQAIKIDSSQSVFFSNLARALFFDEQYLKTKKMLDKSLHLNSNNDEANLILFYLLITKNDLKNAWKYFDSRLNVKNYFIPNNLYSSTKIKNKTVLILREAGLGDEILYSSMYSELIKKNKKVVIECDHRLKNIFKRSFNYNNFISKSVSLRNKSNLDKFNMSIYAGSLSSFFRNKQSDFNYNDFLKPNLRLTEVYNRKLKKINNLPKIGISWISARIDLGKDKSVELEQLLPILKKKNLSFVNLQYGDHAKTINDFNNKHKLSIIDIPELDKFNNIEKLLALIASLDLVLTVSNTTAHLAGAIGKKTLLLAPSNRAQLFYWMFSKHKTPWYPSIQIFKKNKGWNEALKNIQLTLNKIFKD